MSNYGYLAAAILAEIVATSALKASVGFTRWAPTLLTAVGYLIAFYFLSLTLRTVPVGVAYAIWSGSGIVLISVAAFFLFGQRPDFAAMAGMGLIIAGVVVINVFSKTAVH